MSNALNGMVAALLAQGAAAPPAANVQVQSIWDFVVKGGPVMVPIGICSLVALAVLIERSVSLRRRKLIPPDFVAGLRALVARRAAPSEALGFCQSSDSPLARVVSAGLKRMGEPVERLEKQVEEAGQREVLKLRKNLRVLAVVGSVSTLLGLLGTIMGMINAFQTVAASGEALGRTELLAKGIYEALITTAAGLIVAIPVIIAYHWIAARIDGIVAEIDRQTLEFAEAYFRPASAPVRGASEAAAGSPPRAAVHPGAASQAPEAAAEPSSVPDPAGAAAAPALAAP